MNPGWWVLIGVVSFGLLCLLTWRVPVWIALWLTDWWWGRD